MRIGIYGKAGTGKSTFLNQFRNDDYLIVNCDTEVSKAYMFDWDIQNFIKKKYPECIFIGSNVVDKDKLIKVLIKDIKFRKELQKKLYQYVFKQFIDNHNNIIMDGIVPEYAKHFDIVLKASCPEKERINRLINGRGMTKQRIKQIDQLQKGW